VFMSLIRNILKGSGSTIIMYSHFHRSFVHTPKSSWIQPKSFIDNLSDTGIEGLPRGAGSVEDFRHYMPGISDDHFAQIFGQQALEYWIYKKAPKCDFIGCSTYRRYLQIAGAATTQHDRLAVQPSPEI